MADQRGIMGLHLIWSCYGFWLPNDPRGSWSDRVWSPQLRAFGEATKVSTRRSLAHDPHDRALRLTAKEALKFPVVKLTGEQALAVAKGIGGQAERSGLDVYAMAVMPDHVHLATGRHTLPAGRLMASLKSAATRRLVEEGLHPLAGRTDRHGRTPSPWVAGGWKVFLCTEHEVSRCVKYIERNPVQAGLRRQRWSFVKGYCG